MYRSFVSALTHVSFMDTSDNVCGQPVYRSFLICSSHKRRLFVLKFECKCLII